MFLRFRSCYICYWFIYEAQQDYSMCCFSIYTRLQDLIQYSSRHIKNRIFRVLSRLWAFSCIALVHDKDWILVVNCESFLYHLDASIGLFYWVVSSCYSKALKHGGSLLFEGNFTILSWNLIITGVVIDWGKWGGISDLRVPRLKSRRVGLRSRFVNEEFAENLE